MTMNISVKRIVLWIVAFAWLAARSPLGAAEPATLLSDATAQIQLNTFCLECHRQDKVKGKIRLDLPLEQIKELDWHKIVQVLRHSDMPPEKSKQPSKDIRGQLEAWAQSHLDKHILKRAGDPGAVAWRRLTAIELDNMIRDLTGQPLLASRHFPTENFGGEGFSNVGNVQSALSGPVLDKYLAMAEEITKHARFDSDGKLAFDPPGAIVAPEVRQDRALVEIKLISRIACGELYLGPGQRIGGEADERSLDGQFKTTALAWKGPGNYLACLWLARAAKDPEAALDRIAAAHKVNPVYLKNLHRLMMSCPAGSLEESFWVEPMRRLPLPTSLEQPIPDEIRAACAEIGEAIWSCTRRAQSAGLKNLPGIPAIVVPPKSVSMKLATKAKPATKNAKKIESMPLEQLTVTIGHAGNSKADAIVWCGLPTIQVKTGPKTEVTTILLKKEDVDLLPAGAIWKEHKFDQDKSVSAIEISKPVTIVLNIAKYLKDVPQDGLSIEVVIPVDRGGTARAFLRVSLENRSRLQQVPDAEAVWLAADNDQEASIKSEWAALFDRWFPPHPLTIAPFDNRKSFGLPDEVQFFRDDRRLQRQLLDDANRRRLDDLWAYLFMLSNEPRLRLDVFSGKQQIGGLDEAAQLAALEGKVSKDLDHPYGDIPRAPAARLKYYRDEMARHRTLWRQRTLEATLDFATRAWRRPLTDAEKTRFAKRLEDMQPAADKDAEGALRTMLMRVLVSPHFLFRCERIAADTKESPLDAWELATRLSLFLWASLPDDELRKCAADRSLLQDDVLRQQTRRMLADPKARGMAEHFFGQWLGFSGFSRGEADPDREFFPDFTPQVRASLHREASVFFEDLIRKDRDVRLIIDAKYSFLDPTLRQYYGIDKVVPTAVKAPKSKGKSSPRLQAELYLWLDASDAATVVQTDGKVSEWRDKSAKGHHLSPPADAMPPSYSAKGLAGRPSITFDGHILHHSEKRFAYDTHTIIVVAKADQTDAHDIVGTGGVGDGQVLLMNYQGRFRGHHWSAGVVSLDSKTPAITTPAIYVQYDDGETLTLRRNGAEDAAVPLKPVINTAMRPFILGNRVATQRGTFVGEIAEVFVFSGCVSKDELLKLEGHLAHKWGLAGSLPADHPYKAAAKELPAIILPQKGSTSSRVVVPGVAIDDTFLLTDMSSSHRGGVLGLGAILVKNSRTRRTSPVNRGLWVVENLLGQHLPPPPANVPPIPDAAESDQGKTLRQQMVLHRDNAACAACHSRIDPFGFAFEAFDAAGRLRSAEVRKTIEYETTRDGVLLDGVESLRTYLRKRSDDVERNLVRRLLGYALNRPVAVSDFPLIDRALTELAKNEHRLSSVVEQIVLSRQFRAHRAADEHEFAESKK